jgi:MFS family permease
MACRTSYVAALFIRALIGFFESASFPCIYHFFPLWLPNAEKTFLIPVIVSGLYVGTMIGFALSGVLTKTEIMIGGVDWGGWPSVFYVFGTIGVLWFPIWAWLAHESPDVHPSISPEELAWIQEGVL